MTQLDLGLFPIEEAPLRITVVDAFVLLWTGHLGSKPSGTSFSGNRKALCRSFGNRFYDSLTDIDFRKHLDDRLNGRGGFAPVSIGTVFHDHGLMGILDTKLREWKRRGTVIDGINLSRVALPPESPTTGVPKTKGPMRRRVLSPNEFARIQEHADEDLKELIYVLTDTIIRLGDALSLKPEHYNPYTDQIEFTQHKTGKLQIVPPSWRVKKSFVKARRLGLAFVYSGGKPSG